MRHCTTNNSNHAVKQSCNVAQQTIAITQSCLTAWLQTAITLSSNPAWQHDCTHATPHDRARCHTPTLTVSYSTSVRVVHVERRLDVDSRFRRKAPRADWLRNVDQKKVCIIIMRAVIVKYQHTGNLLRALRFIPNYFCRQSRKHQSAQRFTPNFESLHQVYIKSTFYSARHSTTFILAGCWKLCKFFVTKSLTHCLAKLFRSLQFPLDLTV